MGSMARAVARPDDERGEQALDLVARERYQLVRPWVACVFVGTDDGEEGVASMARVTQRRQDVQPLTWCSSGPAKPLPDRKVSSTVHLRPATRTRACPVDLGVVLRTIWWVWVDGVSWCDGVS
jgi:hypothetical protein